MQPKQILFVLLQMSLGGWAEILAWLSGRAEISAWTEIHLVIGPWVDHKFILYLVQIYFL